MLEWALERFAPRIAISTAFQVDGVALIDMAYEIDPDVQVFSVDTGRLPGETFELIERAARALPGPQPRAARAGRAPRRGACRPSTARTSSTARSRSGCSAATSARCGR